jgi:hypothetical protein
MEAGSAGRPVTYQITMCGSDGVVMASDRWEISKANTASVPTLNDINKIRILADGNYALAYSGNRLAHTFTKHVVRAFQAGVPSSDQDARTMLEQCSVPAIQEWREYQAAGQEGEAIVVMASGSTKRIFRCSVVPTAETETMESGIGITGQTGNWAAFLPHRYYRHLRSSSVNELACLAACSILMASQFDPLAVDGLDIAIYRDAERRFRFMESGNYLEGAYRLAEQIDGAVLKFIRTQAAASEKAG